MSDDETVVKLRLKKPISEARRAQMREVGAKNLAKAKLTNYKPAYGNKGDQPAKGAGWGGPAKGPGDKRPMTPKHPEHFRNLPPEVVALKAMAKEARIEAMKDNLMTLALTAEMENTRLGATTAYLNREEGMPVTRQIVAEAQGDEEWTGATDLERAKAMALLLAKIRDAG